MSDVVVTRVIAASPATVFSFFTDLERWTAWQGVDGELDARPGGSFRIRMPGPQVASGHFVEIVPDERLVFTWGWEGHDSPLPPGASTVVVELAPYETGTLVRLTHSSLAPHLSPNTIARGGSATSSACASFIHSANALPLRGQERVACQAGPGDLHQFVTHRRRRRA
jgi:uncharacterized protein YndB with AHSA1/START domain